MGDLTALCLKKPHSTEKWLWMYRCMLRHVESDGSMKFHDWEDKKKYLPLMDYFKTDAAGSRDSLPVCQTAREAARQLHAWGAREIVITHNTEVLAYDGSEILTCPIKARNLSGRTGRGDTTFAGYIAARQEGKSVQDALLYCTALVSLKMETPGLSGERSRMCWII